MRTRTAAVASAFAVLAAPALADAPHVAAGIAPVHSLVARVMEGVGDTWPLRPRGAVEDLVFAKEEYYLCLLNYISYIIK
jgi:ABC-type Zn2+ transport system substrate-binding protein/surface adhesin